MKINIVNLGLNEFFDRKSDIIYVLFHALTDLGHNVSISHNNIERSALNIVIGSDIICNELTALNALIDSKADYAVFEVENFNGATVNYRQKFNLSGYETLIKNSKFCFTPYIYNVPQLAEIVNDKNVVYTKWGFHTSMVCNRIKREKSFIYSAFFYGLVKATRERKVNSLKNRFGERFKIVDQTDPFTFRDYYISKSKLGLSLSYGSFDNFVNPFRLYHMVANGMPVLSDHIQDDDGYSDLCLNTNFEQLLENIDQFEIEPETLNELCRSTILSNSLKACF